MVKIHYTLITQEDFIGFSHSESSISLSYYLLTKVKQKYGSRIFIGLENFHISLSLQYTIFITIAKRIYFMYGLCLNLINKLTHLCFYLERPIFHIIINGKEILSC
jgi:hypothetical protein